MDLSSSLYRLRKDDIRKASEVLSRAFFNDADLVKILPDPGTREKKLKMMFVPFIRFGILYGEVYAPTEDLEGVALWNHSSRKDITLLRSIRSGFMGMVSKLGKEERRLFTKYGKEIDAGTKRTIKEEHWFLFILGIDPDHQRKGFGTRLLDPMLERIDSEGLPVMLDTNKRENLPYYERFGFNVRNRYKVLENDHWGMVRGRN